VANKQNKKKNGQLTVYKQNKPVNKANNNEKAVTKYVQEKPVKKSKGGFDWKAFLIFGGISVLCLLWTVLPDPIPAAIDDAITAVASFVSGITAIAVPLIGLFSKKN